MIMKSGHDLVSTITYLLKKHGVLNAYQICRLLNGCGKDEYARCYFSFKDKPLGSSAPNKRACKHYDECNPKITTIHRVLEKAGFPSRKMRFRDKGGIGENFNG